MFSGVRFALIGFNAVDANTLRSKLSSGGGVDVGQFTQTSTHLIVDNLVYDDPICVAARSSGKVVVTGLWVHHSFDFGTRMDSNSVLYRPVKDFDGVPGFSSLVVCLTGYQRQDREDIMTMVGLMGGEFSKPLVAHRVTHLICYKFEGEKYDLAKRMKRIKLVNHRWVEDCLKNWKLLPEGDYEISGHELETMEASAMDSEDESENPTVKREDSSPLGLRVRAVAAVEKSMSGGQDQSNSGAQEGSSFFNASRDNWLAPKKMDGPLEAMVSTDAVAAEQHNHQREIKFEDTSNLASPTPINKTPEQGMRRIETDDYTSINRSIRRHTSLATYSRNTLSGTPEIETLEKQSSGQNSLLRMDEKGLNASPAVNISASKLGSSVERTTLFEDLDKIDKLHDGEPPLMLPQVTDESVHDKGSQKVYHNIEAPIPPLASLLLQKPRPDSPRENLRTVPSINDPSENGEAGDKSPASVPNTKLLSSDILSMEDALPTAEKIISNCELHEIPERSSTEPMAGNILLQEPRSGSPKQNLRVEPNINDHTEGEEPARTLGVSDSATRLCSTPPGLGLTGVKNQLETEQPKKKTAPRKSLGTRGRKENPTNQKGSIYLKDSTPKDERSDCLDKGGVSASVTDNGNQKEMSSPVLDTETVPEMAKHIHSETEPLKKIDSPDSKSSASEEKDHLVLDLIVNQDKLQAKTPEETNADVDIAMPEPELNDVPTKDPSDGALQLEVEVNKSKRKREATVGKNSLQSGKKEASSTVKVGNSSVKKTKKSRKEHDAKANDTVMTGVGGNSVEKENLALENKSGQVKSGGDQCPVAGATLAREKAAFEDPREATVQLQVDKKKGKRKKDATVEKSRLESGKKESPCTVEFSVKKTKKSKKATDNSTKGKENIAASGKPLTRKDVAKSAKTGTKAGKKSKQINAKPLAFTKVLQEPKVFIVSGIRSQRNEYQRIIRRLKGKCCTDSHHWSFQATHFIATEIRRTEKFFAAAASGSWIMKTDYVADSKEAGKLLPEEPYEWYGTGLSADGAISLESPRKWRLVKEQTGHGALYGMHIVIYGDCTIPSLDTLKRAVKAGGGTILATAPPYTRFLNQNTDFALVSPGIPREDVWIEEFIRHEIPCVLVDYIVEYVCKPGYELNEHVLYNTNSWAQRSFNTMQVRTKLM